MNTQLSRALFAMFIAALLTTSAGFVIVGCDEYDRVIGEDDDDGSALAGALPSGAISGNYLTSILANSQNSPTLVGTGSGAPCVGDPIELTILLTIAQTGPNSYLISNADLGKGESLGEGMLAGNILTFQTINDTPFGTETADFSWAFVILPDGTSIFTGTANGTLVNGDFSCTNAAEFEGTRVPEVEAGEGLTGIWTLEVTGLENDCQDDPQGDVTIPVAIVQIGTDVTITLVGLAVLNGTLIEKSSTLSISGSYTDPDTGNTVDLEGPLTIDGNEISGTITYLYSGGEDCSGEALWEMERIEL